MIKLTTDSTCDLNEEIIKKYDIEVIPVHIVVDEKVYNDNVDIYPRDVFHFVEKENKTCRTAAINVYEYHQFFEPLAKKYETVIHVSLGSEFSSCHQNASLAARGFDNVHVIDSANLSTGSGFLVYRLAQLIKDEASQNEVLKTAEDLVKKINGSFVIDTLDYLYKGGRCSGLEMVGTKMLKIKPTIEVFNGKMRVAGKCRGSFERCVKNYVTERLKNIDNIDKKTIFITNAESSDELVEYVTNKIKTDYDFNEIVMCQAGCTISAHCGPTTLGIFYLEK